ncbi:unnamed protein product, partial [Sphacelaria rigidula]
MRTACRSPAIDERTGAPACSGVVLASDRSDVLLVVHGTKGAAGRQGVTVDGRKCGRRGGANEVEAFVW